VRAEVTAELVRAEVIATVIWWQGVCERLRQRRHGVAGKPEVTGFKRILLLE